MEVISRKRLRSDDNNFGLQFKVYVDQKTLDLTNDDKMKKIYNKTIDLLFKGSKCSNNKDNLKLTKEETFSNIILNGTGKVKFLNDKVVQNFKVFRKSDCCGKSSLMLSDCTNCNLNLCEHCAYSCMAGARLCGAILCGTCITLFGCGTLEEPICTRCKYMT